MAVIISGRPIGANAATGTSQELPERHTFGFSNDVPECSLHPAIAETEIRELLNPLIHSLKIKGIHTHKIKAQAVSKAVPFRIHGGNRGITVDPFIRAHAKQIKTYF